MTYEKAEAGRIMDEVDWRYVYVFFNCLTCLILF
jgi:hypothetical protein